MITKITILYQHLLWADALQSLINESGDFAVVDFNPIQSICTRSYQSDSIHVLEATYPNAETVGILKQLKAKGLRVVVVGYFIDNEFIELMLQMDLNAFVLKTCGKNNLYEALRQVNGGNKYFCAPITEGLSRRLSGKYKNGILTAREKEILMGLVSMCSSADIASSLNICEATVRTHRKNIMQKFGARNYIGLIRYACREGLLEAPGEQFCQGCRNRNCFPTLLR